MLIKWEMGNGNWNNGKWNMSAYIGNYTIYGQSKQSVPASAYLSGTYNARIGTCLVPV